LDPPAQRFDGRLVLLGYGSVGQGVLPLLLRHVDLPRDRVIVVAPAAGAPASRLGVQVRHATITRDNLDTVLAPLLGRGDFLLNLSVNVSSLALVAFCRRRGALYLDTCIEPWDGGYSDPRLPPAARSNHALREAALALRTPSRDAPTALITHGANPGIVSHFVKRALLDIARDTGAQAPAPASREGWARLAQRLGVRVIHVSERDSQVSPVRRAVGEFVNTWSVEGFIDEACCQPAELGWGTHEQHFPEDGQRHLHGCGASIWLDRPGSATRVRSWAPLAGAFHGFLVTHSESISIADHLTLGDPMHPAYRPTVHYAYHPCDDAVLSLHELSGHERRTHPAPRIARDELDGGIDELGVLLAGHAKGAYWLGSRLSLARARELAPDNSATSLQVAAGVLSGALWVMRHPACDVVEPDDLPFDELLALCGPYLGDLVGEYTHWTPLEGRGWLFDEAVDATDPWQFCNVRVS
jgi:homospermidine synthase